MSDAEESGLLRTVTDTYRSKPVGEMNAFSLVYTVVLAILLLPLLPFLAVIWLAGKAGDWLDDVSAA